MNSPDTPASEGTHRSGAPVILVVEDDARLADLVAEYLQANGMTVHIESRGDRAVDRVRSLNPDVVVLDIMLPGLDGLEVCRRIRPTFSGGILMVTARGDDIDEVVGLELGADDYLAKPVRPRVLLAHLAALLRRLPASATTVRTDASSPRRLAVGRVVIDASNRTVFVSGSPVALTTAEFDLLWLLAQHTGEVMDRDAISLALRGIPHDGLDRTVDLRIARLRKKLGDDARDPVILKSIRGVGYLLAAHD